MCCGKKPASRRIGKSGYKKGQNSNSAKNKNTTSTTPPNPPTPPYDVRS